MRLRISAIASLLGVVAFMAACDLMEDKPANSMSPEAAARAAAAAKDSATAHNDSITAARKDSSELVAKRAAWKADSLGFITAAKTAADKWKADSTKAKKKFTADSLKAYKQYKKDSTNLMKDSTAGIKALSKDSANWVKKRSADSLLYEKAVAAMAKKYTADSTALEKVHAKYLALLGKDSAAITAAQEAYDADTGTKAKASKATKLEKANAKLVADQAKYDEAVAKAALKTTTDSTKGEETKQAKLDKRATDSAAAVKKFSDDSTKWAGKVADRWTTIGTAQDKDSTTFAADTAAYNLALRTKLAAKVSKDSLDSLKHRADSIAIVSADSIYKVRKAVPVFSSAAGTYTDTTTITLTSSFDRIHYTLDGSDPSDTSASTAYTSGIKLTVGKTIKAIAHKTGYAATKVLGQTYVIGSAGVSIASSVDTTGDSVRVQFKGLENATDFYYTVDGVTAPTTTVGTKVFKVSSASDKDTISIKLGVSATVKVLAAKTGRANSAVLSKAFKLTLPTPVYSHPTDTIKTDSLWVRIADSAKGVTIRYTLTGVAPASITGGTGIASGDSIKITSTSILKAIAFRTGATASAAASVTDSIKCGTVDTSFAVVGGHGNDSLALTATLTTSSPNATIYYTIAGGAATAYNASSKPKILEGQLFTTYVARTGSKNGPTISKQN